ncbi:M28 family peptidase [Hymenobacter sp. BT175]|uniref:M28 family peptidase n=1 Tax=Hymenobacter translucens TaxID=2886507 RepID=UPI001D0DFC42|nr:M28 family peptidase [Hymenobacter translucens]MCC2545153.1 M28 family peptidase [Hymenobacter translucens]
MQQLLKYLVFGLGLACCARVQPAHAQVPASITKALDKVKPADFKAHVSYLADDKLRGRQPGTPGYQMAVDYVIKQLKAAGVEPVGENGSFVQKVRLRRAFAEPGGSLSLQGAPLKRGEDFTFYPNPEQPATSVTAPLAFVGFGISAPELGYDDYAGLNVQGRVVVVMRGEPRGLSGNDEKLYATDLLTVLQTAVRHGAVGVLLAPLKSSPLPNLSKGQVSVVGADGHVVVSRSFASTQLQAVGVGSHGLLQKLFAGASADTARALSALRSGKTSSQLLATTVTAVTRSRYQDVESFNVVGQIRGSDPVLRNEYVVHSAHLDHLGIGPAVQGDSLYNGAHDNATGVASVLEIAKVYQRLPQKPRRSVLLVLMTGEEMGLVGSGYFARFPTVPKASLVANVNTDMPTIIAPLLSVVALGAENSTLDAEVARAAAQLGLTVEPDPEPGQSRFIRSDQYSFVTQGIPAVHLKYGNRTADGKNNLSAQVQQWRAKYYHKPQDDLNGQFDFEAGRRYVQLNFLLGYQIAQNQTRPAWKPGNFFGKRFGRQ